MTGIALLEYQFICMSKLVSDDARVAGLYITCILGPISMICLKWGMRHPVLHRWENQPISQDGSSMVRACGRNPETGPQNIRHFDLSTFSGFMLHSSRFRDP